MVNCCVILCECVFFLLLLVNISKNYVSITFKIPCKYACVYVNVFHLVSSIVFFHFCVEAIRYSILKTHHVLATNTYIQASNISNINYFLFVLNWFSSHSNNINVNISCSACNFVIQLRNIYLIRLPSMSHFCSVCEVIPVNYCECVRFEPSNISIMPKFLNKLEENRMLCQFKSFGFEFESDENSIFFWIFFVFFCYLFFF